MDLREFKIGQPFWTGAGKWICTDIGIRTIVATTAAEMYKYQNMPELCNEIVFMKYDWDGCWATEEEYHEIIEDDDYECIKRVSPSY